MNLQSKKTLSVGFLFLLTAIVLGAFGAHALEPKMSDIATYDTASKYHFYGAFYLIALGILRAILPSLDLRWAVLLGIIGTLLFSGTVYLLAFRDDLPSSLKAVIGPLTPVGGTLLIISVILTIIKINKNELR